MNHNRKIRTFSGRYVDVFLPDLDTIDILDIAHALARACRFGGHVVDFYSVAQHSVWVAERLPKELQLMGLLHDATEAFMVDMPKPIKRELPEYNEIEDVLMAAIAKKFNIQYPFPPILKTIDIQALDWEWENKVLRDTDVTANWDYKTGKQKFLEKFNELILVAA